MISSSLERVFSEKKREPAITFAERRGPASVNPKLKDSSDEILEGINAIGPRLDAIEKDIKEIREALGIGKVSSVAGK